MAHYITETTFREKTKNKDLTVLSKAHNTYKFSVGKTTLKMQGLKKSTALLFLVSMSLQTPLAALQGLSHFGFSSC